ncbi:MAG TPA: hypothetical protein EYH34_02655 [Planctomycetes bacterium]|nr:hypothetical protein [Planctomycetota bacterium]
MLRFGAFWVVGFVVVGFGGGEAWAEGVRLAGNDLVTAVGVHGGLVVQVGGCPDSPALHFAATGRFLVHVLCPPGGSGDSWDAELNASGLYGLVSVEKWRPGGRLPYTEDLVNVVLVPQAGVTPPLEEVRRVLAPGGVLAVAPGAFSAAALSRVGLTAVRPLAEGTDWLMARKPWPVEMDEWTHPRHGADGNAVSSDTLVAPPRRVRWVVGATAEVPGIVTAGGRNYYGALLARDSFNGLRLWARDLTNPSAAGPAVMKRPPPESPSPIATRDAVFVLSGDRVVGLDPATGNVLRTYDAAGRPRELLYDEGMLIAVAAGAVRAVDAASGAAVWERMSGNPRCTVAGDSYVAFIEGRPERGERPAIVVLDKRSGQVRWRRTDLAWIGKVKRCVYHDRLLACEVSSFTDDSAGNSLHLLSAADGSLLWERNFMPGMNHIRQARAMFIGDKLWVLAGGKDAQGNPHPVRGLCLDIRTGQVEAEWPAGLTHCFPPVATLRYLLAGELDMTDLQTGRIDANRITKAACSRDHGWVPANGLIYVTPKHCVCWPMLRGYAALAPQRPGGGAGAIDLERFEFPLERGVDAPDPTAFRLQDDAWPCYRHDAWRSGSTPSSGPAQAEVVWSIDLGGRPEGPIADDWRENPFVKGPVTSPVVAGGLVYVARPDAHEVVAADAATGRVRWRFRANGRVDTAPTIQDGLCLFGAKSGWVYCLRADDGRMVWRLRAAPLDERIVAYGQLESPWPVPGSVLVVEGTAFFAAGRQSFADGGILVFAVDPASGAIRWVRRHNTVPQQGFYECSALEFDNFDLLHRQGTGVAMSRWVFDRATGRMSIQRWDAFARLNTGGGSAMVPQGTWSYAPRHQRRIPSYTPHRPLVVFRDNRLWGVLQGMRGVYRRDFHLEEGEQFDARWMTGWAASEASRNGQMPWRSHRLAEKATWRVDLFPDEPGAQTIEAMVLAGDRLWIAGSHGDLIALSAENGERVLQSKIPAPLWDGMAVAYGKLYLSTAGGKVLCLGSP